MMKYCVLPLVLILAACAKTPPSVVATSAPTQAIQSEIKIAELANIYEQDSIGAVVSLLQTPPVQAASEAVAEQVAESPKELKTPQAVRKPKERVKPNPPKPPVPKPKTKPNHTSPKTTTPVSETTQPASLPEKAQEVPTLAEIAPIASNNDVYVSAQKAYQQREYRKVVNLLRSADSGGDGSVSARKQMYLLLLAHQKLQNCQSVISIGQRLAGQFSGSNESAEAQFMVGQCQWSIQQRDIAKETWRRLIASQPQSAAAKRAKTSLEQK